jgi:hypothetical protein
MIHNAITKFEIINNPPKSKYCLLEVDKETICNASDIYAKIIYDDKHTKVIPKAKFNLGFGFKSCHKKGMPNINIGNAVMPSLLLTTVNQYDITII